MSGLVLGILSAGLIAATIVLWIRFINDVSLGGRRKFLYGLIVSGAALGALALTREPGWIGGALASVGLVGGGIWILLGLLAGQSKQESNVILGEPLPVFSAPDQNGDSFDIESLRGHPVLIKLFRGHW